MVISYSTTPAVPQNSPPFTPPQLPWARGLADTKNFKITNTGTEVFRVRVAGQTSPAPTNDFDWSGFDENVAVGATKAFNITAPSFGTGSLTTDIPFEIISLATGQVEPPGPLAPGIVRCVIEDVSVGYGDIVIARLVPNPPGIDVDTGGSQAADDGEALEISNWTTRNLDLTGCTITQLVFNRTGVAAEVELLTFAPNPTRLDFGKNCILPAGQSLKVLTRKRRNDEGPGAVGAKSTLFKYFLEREIGVWNNSGDRATIYNSYRGGASFADRQRVASFGYGNQRTFPNDPTPPWPQPVVQPEQPPTIVFGPTEFPVPANLENGFPVPFDLQDGDVITLNAKDAELVANWVTNGIDGPGTIVLQTLFGIRLFPSGRGLGILPLRALPANNAPATAGSALVPGAPLGALLFRIDEVQPGRQSRGQWALNAGSTTPFAVTLNGIGRLFLGVNDLLGSDVFGNSFFMDNSGEFRVTVSILR